MAFHIEPWLAGNWLVRKKRLGRKIWRRVCREGNMEQQAAAAGRWSSRICLCLHLLKLLFLDEGVSVSFVLQLEIGRLALRLTKWVVTQTTTIGQIKTLSVLGTKKRKRQTDRKGKSGIIICICRDGRMLQWVTGRHFSFFGTGGSAWQCHIAKAEIRSWLMRVLKSFNATDCCVEKCFGGDKEAAWWSISSCNGKLTTSTLGWKKCNYSELLEDKQTLSSLKKYALF